MSQSDDDPDDRVPTLPVTLRPLHAIEKALAPYRRIQSLLPKIRVPSVTGGSSVHEFSKQLQTLRDAVDPPLLRKLRETLEAVHRAIEWYRRTPATLRAALHASGWVPHPELGLSDLRTVTSVFDESGAAAAADALGRANVELFDDARFRRAMADRWQKSSRAHVLREVTDAFSRGHYFTCIPTALAQCEGLIAQVARHKGHMKQHVMRAHAHGLVDQDPLLAESVPLLLDVLLAKFEHGDAIPAPLSRHAVLHGGDVQYGTKENAVRALVWLDILVMLETDPEAFKGLQLDTTSAPPEDSSSE